MSVDSKEGVLFHIDKTQYDAPLAVITLNRPEVHNRLERDDMSRIVDIIREVNESKDIRALLLSGAGERTFCSGAALNQLLEGEIGLNQFEALTSALDQVKVPTVCSLNGNVFGGGVELVLCCDFVIGLTNSRAFVPPAKLGLCYATSGLKRYVSKVGLKTAKRLLVANETFSGEELYRTGVYDYLVDREERQAKEREVVERLLGLAPLAVQNMKASLNEIAADTLDEVAALKREEQCATSKDLMIGLDAYLKKETPEFKGE